MSQSQGIEVRRPSRRTIAAGAAWAVPVIAVGAAAPAMAASGECVPGFTAVEGSFKCCDGSTTVNGKKNMKVVIQISDVNGCLDDGSDVICIDSVLLANRQPIGSVVFVGPKCTTVGGTVTVYLLDVQSCTVNLLVDYSVNGSSVRTAAIKSDNISSGNAAGDCIPPK
jgi:hypothetical protein